MAPKLERTVENNRPQELSTVLDHMSMPVLFAILIGLLAVVTVGVFVTLRIVGERSKAGDEARAPKLHRR